MTTESTVSELSGSRELDVDGLLDTWALSTSMARDLNRFQQSPEQVRRFYDVMQHRVDGILEYLNQFDLASLPAEEERLLNLCFAYAEVAHSIELKWLGMYDEHRIKETIPLS